MRPKGMKDLAAFTVREVKRAAAEERERDEVFLCIRTVRVKVKSKVIPASFLKIERGVRLLGRNNGEREGQLQNWKVIKIEVLKHLLRAR